MEKFQILGTICPISNTAERLLPMKARYRRRRKTTRSMHHSGDKGIFSAVSFQSVWRQNKAYLFPIPQQADAASLRSSWCVLGTRIPTFVDELLFDIFPILCLVAVRCLKIEVSEASFDACFRIVLIRNLLFFCGSLSAYLFMQCLPYPFAIHNLP